MALLLFAWVLEAADPRLDLPPSLSPALEFFRASLHSQRSLRHPSRPRETILHTNCPAVAPSPRGARRIGNTKNLIAVLAFASSPSAVPPILIIVLLLTMRAFVFEPGHISIIWVRYPRTIARTIGRCKPGVISLRTISRHDRHVRSPIMSLMGFAAQVLVLILAFTVGDINHLRRWKQSAHLAVFRRSESGLSPRIRWLPWTASRHLLARGCEHFA